MRTYKRICLKDYILEDSVGNKMELKRGQEYNTSEEKDEKVVVFTNFWVKGPVELFAGEILFTK